MGSKEKRERKVTCRFKPYKTEQAIRKEPGQRKLSVRKLESFDAVREQFESLAMSNRKDNEANPSQNDDNPRDVANSQPGDVSAHAPSVNAVAVDQKKVAIEKNLTDRQRPLRMLKEFSKNTSGSVSRQALAGVANKVHLRQQIETLDNQLDAQYYEWLDCCGQTSEDLESAVDPLRPSLIASKFEESGEILDKVDEIFKKIKDQYPDKQVVIDYLDFIDKSVKEKPDALPTQKSASEGSSRDEEYIKAKLPKIKKDVETKFNAIKSNFESVDSHTEHSLNQILKQLESLLAKVDDDSPLEKLLRDAYDIPDLDVTEHEEWQDTQKALIETLLDSVSDSLGKVLGKKVEKEEDHVCKMKCVCDPEVASSIAQERSLHK